jgi:hypothetical protein
MMRFSQTLVALALLAACKQQEEPAKQAPQGNYPTAKYVASAGSVTADDFTKSTADCTDEKSIAISSFNLGLKAMSADAKPTMLDYGVDDVQLKDGAAAKVAAVLYSIEPGDPGALSHIVDVYLLNDECRITLLKQDFLD